MYFRTTVRVLVPSFVDYHNKIPSYESTKVMSYLRIIHTRTLSFLSVHVRNVLPKVPS